MVSIIIIVKNDRGIENTLTKLQTIKKPEATEIIVVDASKGKIDDIAKKFKKVQWIAYKNKHKHYTIPEQRNIAVKKAKGDVIVFIDANCIPMNQWLMELYKMYKEGEKIVAGPIIPKDKDSIVNINVPIDHKEKYLDECATINVLIDKQVFRKVGMFDESFHYGSDVDFMWRAIDAGYKIRFSKNARVSHDWGDIQEEFSRSFKYGSARSYLLKKHPKHIKKFIKKNYIEIGYMLFIIGLPITFIMPFYPLIILSLIINNIRYNQPVKLVALRLSFALGFLKQLIVFFYESQKKGC